MTRPTILDLGCSQGGCSVGYYRAGFDVVGVDILPQPKYPFLEIHQGDMVEALDDKEFVSRFAAIHASPPCQLYSSITKMWDPGAHPDLVGPVREKLAALGKPYVIENVPGAPLVEPVVLCGTMFGLALHDGTGELRRHRLFESNIPLSPPRSCRHTDTPTIGVYGRPGGSSLRDGGRHSLKQWREAMGLPHMTAEGLAQAIPPDYTEWIGRQIMAHLLAPQMTASA